MAMPRNTPISQVDVEEKILQLIDELETTIEEFEVLAVDSAKKEARAKGEWASAYLKEDGAVRNREAWADYRTNEAQFEAKVADALMRAKREKLNGIRTSLDGLRTIAANVRNMVNG